MALQGIGNDLNVSSPANIALIESGRVQTYYNRNAGSSLPFMCLDGPPAIPSFVREYWSSSDGWLGEVYAEGGILLDLDVRLMLIHGGSEYFNELGFRRVFLSILRNAYPSWSIEWAHGGQGDFLRRAGLDPQDIFNDIDPEPTAAIGTCQSKNPNSVCTTRDGSDLRVYALDCYAPDEYCRMGEAFVSRLADLEHTNTVEFDGTVIYEGGLHIDLADRSLKVWTMDPIAELESRFSGRWPGWHIRSWGDNIERHIVAAENRIRYSTLPDIDHLSRLKNLIDERFKDSLTVSRMVLREIERRLENLA